LVNPTFAVLRSEPIDHFIEGRVGCKPKVLRFLRGKKQSKRKQLILTFIILADNEDMLSKLITTKAIRVGKRTLRVPRCIFTSASFTTQRSL
jgi:hypothetical protein